MLFVNHSKSGWKIKNPDNSKASGIFDTKAEAIKKAIEIAKNQKLELIVQNMDGKISEKNSYGNDPAKIKG